MCVCVCKYKLHTYNSKMHNIIDCSTQVNIILAQFKFGRPLSTPIPSLFFKWSDGRIAKPGIPLQIPQEGKCLALTFDL